MRGDARLGEDVSQRFSALYDQQFAFVWRVLRRLGLRGAATEDAAQEVWLVVFRHLDRLDPAGSPRPWLYTIARRIAWRQRRTRTRAERKIRALKAAPARLEPGVDARLEATTVIESYLERLRPEQRQAFLLFELLAMTGKEVAATVGIKEATAYSRLRLARERLGSMVADDEREELVVMTREADVASPEQPRRTWALLIPSIGAPGPAVPATPDPSAPPTLAARAVTAITSSPAISGTAAAVLAGLIFIAAGTKPVDTSPDSSAGRPPGGHAEVPQGPDSELPTPELNPPGSTAPNLDSPDSPDSPSHADGPALPHHEQRAADRAPPGEQSPRASSGGKLAPAPADPEPTEQGQDPLTRETALLIAARQALANDRPSLALTHLDEHARSFRESALFDVREASRVDALCALGRSADASRVADALARTSTSAAASSAVRVAAESCVATSAE